MNRRNLLKSLLAIGAIRFIPYSGRVFSLEAKKSSIILKPIPKSGELIPAIGMGTWITFNVGSSKKLIDQRKKVLEQFFKYGGRVIDSSPMYGSSEEVIGKILKELGEKQNAFAATKIWTSSKKEGVVQFQNSQRLWGLKSFELEQIHNLLNWEEHLKTLRDLKEKGAVKYIGITTSHGNRHAEIAKIMKSEPIDFVQLTYNAQSLEAEELLKIAVDKNIAVIANRPYEGGSLIDLLKKQKLPSWAKDRNINSFAQMALKYIISHPAVTCAIPATSKVEHMRENMQACYGELLDEKMRTKIRKYIHSL